MKKLIIALLVGSSLALGLAPAANADKVVVVHHHHHRHQAKPAMVLVPGYWHGPFWHRVWVAPHYVPAH